MLPHPHDPLLASPNMELTRLRVLRRLEQMRKAPADSWEADLVELHDKMAADLGVWVACYMTNRGITAMDRFRARSLQEHLEKFGV